MVSFRHHLISIVAIFLALAVGVALGAGPLRDGASNLLVGENENLTAERDQLRADLDAAHSEITDRDSVFSSLAASASDGALRGVSVGLLTIPGAEGEDVDAALAALTAAGAEITAEATVTEAWADSDLAFRQSYSGQVAGYLAERAPTDATPEYVLAAALAQVMAGGSEAELIGELLVAGDSPFVNEVPANSAEVMIVVGPRVMPEMIDWAPVLNAFDATTPTVGIGDGLVLPARATGSAASTVDSLPAAFAVASLPLAAAAELAGTGGHWGVAEGAVSAVPPLPREAQLEPEPSAEPADEASPEPTPEPETDEPDAQSPDA